MITFGLFNFFDLIFIPLLFLIDSIGEIFEAFLALLNADRYIVTIPKPIATTKAIQENDNTSFNPLVNISFKNKLLIIINIVEASIPNNNPNGIPINPNIVASKNTFFLICFFVAPILFNIPYCFVFSAIDISKLFFIQKTDVNTIIPQTTATTVPSPPTVLLFNGFVSKSIKYEFML